MSKDIRLKVNGQYQAFQNVKEISTGLLATSRKQTWIPKDEVSDYVNLVDLTPTQNGLYRVANPGETAHTIQHDDGTVEQIIEADGIASVTPNVTGSVIRTAQFTKNGTYDAKNYEGSHADGFKEFDVDVTTTAKQQTCRDAFHTYIAKDVGVEGFEKVIVDVKDPMQEEYQRAFIAENGDYDAEDRNGYGFFLADVNVKKEKLSIGWLTAGTKQLTQDIQRDYFINAAAYMMYNDFHVISQNKHIIWSGIGSEESSIESYLLPRYFIETSTSRPCLLEHNGQLHLLGGNGTGTYAGKDHQHWVYQGNEWVQKADLSEAPIDAVEYKGEIWYYTATGKLIRIRGGFEETMLEIGVITGSRICVYHDRIYIIGGYADTEDYPNLGIISFHPIDGMRQEIPMLPYMLVDPILVVHDDRIRILGSKSSVDNPFSKKYFTDLVFSDRFIGYGTHFSREAGGVSTQYPFMANYVNCFEYNGTLHAVGVYYTNDDLLYDWILTEEEL